MNTLTFGSKQHWLIFAFTTSITFLVYLQTISPSIAGGDSGELVAEGCQLGTSHPPGYPLYTIIVYIATKIGKVCAPWKPPAYFVNLTSVIFGSTASGLVSSSILFLIQITDLRDKERGVTNKEKITKSKKLTKNKTNDEAASLLISKTNKNNDALTMSIASFMGMMHSFSPLVWQYSVTAEVFALHIFFVSIIVHTTIRFAIHGDEYLMLWGAFLCGLAMTNQHTSILLSIPLILWVLSVTKLHLPRQWRGDNFEKCQNLFPTRKIPLLLKAAMSFLFGFVLLYGTMPLFVHSFHHAGSWGDVTSFKGFMHHFLRSDYGSLRLYSGNDDNSEGLWERLVLWSSDLIWAQSLPFVGVVAFIASKDLIIRELWKLRSNVRRNGKTGIIVASDDESMSVDTAILCSLLFYLIVFHSLSNLPLKNPLFFGIHQRFWMHPNLLCFILSGQGLSKLCRKFTPNSTAKAPLFSCLFFAIAVSVYRKGYQLSDQTNNVYFRNYASSILKTLPKDSVLFINYDQQWTSVRYMQECEGLRPDITSINLSMMSFDWWSTKHELYPKIKFPGSRYTIYKGGFTFKDLLDVNNNFDGKAFIGGGKTFEEKSYSREYSEVPHGIVRRIIKANSEGDITAESYRRNSQLIWQIIGKEHAEGLPSLKQYGNETWEWTVHREFYEHFTARASYLLDLAISGDKSDSSKLKSLVEACAWLEIAKMNDDISKRSPGLWKNLGLAYMKMVQNKEEVYALPLVKDVFLKTANAHLFKSIENLWWNSTNGNDWKQWSSMRWEKNWGYFVQMEGASADPSFQQVKSMYDTVLSNIGR